MRRGAARPKTFDLGAVVPGAAFRTIARACFGAASLTALATAGVVALATPTRAPATRLGLVACLLACAAIAAWACGRSAAVAFPVRASLSAAAISAMVLAGSVGLTLGDGARDPALGVLGLVVCIITATSTLRSGVVLAGLAVAEIAALALVETRGWG